MASVQAVRSRTGIPVFVLGMMMLCLTVPAMADPDIDLEFSNIQDLQEVARQDGTVAFTFHTLGRNVGNKPIPWGFPVKKPSSLPAGGYDHDVPRAVTDVNFGKSNTVGPHPHLRFFLYRRLPGGEPEKIGESDLKHAFRAGGGDNHHVLPVKGSDSYSPANNRDRSFYSPAAEDMFNDRTGEILVHEHLGRDTGQSIGGFRVFERDHRDADHRSPLTHLLQANIADLDPARNPDGTRWFLVGTYYVAGDRDATRASDFFTNTDNTRWVQIQPKNASTRFKFDYPGVTGSGLDQIREKPMPEAQTRGGGGGRVDSMGPPPSPFFFSKSLFLPDTFHFEKRIDLRNNVTIRPTLVDFRGRIDFTPTTEKGFFLATVNQIEFEYAPFNLPPDLYPEPLFTGIERESLDVIANPEISGFLDTKAGRLFIEVPMNWTNTQGELVATSLDYLQVDITGVAGFPDLVDLAWDSSGSFNPVPEPCPFALLAAGASRREARQ